MRAGARGALRARQGMEEVENGMDIREHTRAYAQKSDAMGALSLFATLAVYALALTLGALNADRWWIVAPMVVLVAFSGVRLYVLQHDCGHHSLFATR